MNDKNFQTQQKHILYHVIKPIDNKKLLEIKNNGCFFPSNNALGGQSNGYYFFTTFDGAKQHIETNKNLWNMSDSKKAYIIECEINSDDIKYPNWKLDYESMQDFLFDMIYNIALKHVIKFNNIEIKATDNKLVIIHNNKFIKIKNFCASVHSGLVENISDFLYKNDTKFKDEYDKLLLNVFLGNGSNKELYAVKTSIKQTITKITEIKITPINKSNENSQISKYLTRYGKR